MAGEVAEQILIQFFEQPPSTRSVIAEHSRPKDGVASARLCPAIHLLRKMGPGHLNASNKPGRVALVRSIVSLRPLTAFIATHPGAELVERHGLSIGIRSRSILNGTHTVPLQHSQPIQG